MKSHKKKGKNSPTFPDTEKEVKLDDPKIIKSSNHSNSHSEKASIGAKSNEEREKDKEKEKNSSPKSKNLQK